jgi:hypothetical protein|nr:MAG TPA: lipolytic protein [Caudoviricetes sp.]
MSIQTKTMTVKSDTSLAETTTTIRDTVTFDVSSMPNGVTYKGLKAVLSFADPIQWNRASSYDALTVAWDDATHASYASKRPVPQNIELTNEFYWFRTADLDAQVEMYRQEVQEFDGRITANAQAISAETTRAENEENKLSGKIDEIKAMKNLIVFGDSWSDQTDTGVDVRWPPKLASYLGMNLVNKAQSGCSFTASSFNFYNQINDYLKTIEDYSKIGCIVFIGGVNDQGTNINEAFNLTMGLLYPIAKKGIPVVYIPNIRWNNDLKNYNKWQNPCYDAATNGVIVDNMIGWFTKGCYTNDNLHLTGYYNGTIAGRVLNLLGGGNPTKFYYQNNTIEPSGCNLSINESFSADGNTGFLTIYLNRGVGYDGSEVEISVPNLLGLNDFYAEAPSKESAKSIMKIRYSSPTSIKISVSIDSSDTGKNLNFTCSANFLIGILK